MMEGANMSINVMLITLFTLIGLSSIKCSLARNGIDPNSIRHEVVQPVKTCLDASCHRVRLSLKPQGGRVLSLDLERNEELISDDYFIQVNDAEEVQGRSGATYTDCFYLSYTDDVLASISFCDDYFEGSFTIGNESYSLHYENHGHCLYRSSDLPQERWAGDNDVDLSMARAFAEKHLKDGMTTGRRAEIDVIPLNMYIEIVFVYDKAAFKLHENRDHVKKESLAVINELSGLFRKLDVRKWDNTFQSSDTPKFHTILRGIVIWEDKDEIVGRSDVSYYLFDFIKYTYEVVYPKRRNDVTIMISGRNFPDTPNVLGLTLRSMICTSSQLAAIVALKTKRSRPEQLAATIAHEIGHGLGLYDLRFEENWACQGATNYRRCINGCKSPNGPSSCLMSSCSSPNEPTRGIEWSDCSIEMAEKRFSDGRYWCLGNKPVLYNQGLLHSYGHCGNGIIERGEECDCSIEEEECQKCCGENCKLKPDARCSSGACCKNCKVMAKGKKCRESFDNDCDVEDFCDGVIEHCNDHRLLNMSKKECGNSTEKWCMKGRCEYKCFKNCNGHGSCHIEGTDAVCKCQGLYYGLFCQYKFSVMWHIVLGIIFGAIAFVITSIVFAIQDRYYYHNMVY